MNPEPTSTATRIAVVSGGVGAARFLSGLIDAIGDLDDVGSAETITAVVNTGDDCTLHGLSISPDLDTVTYTLAGAIDPERGWGLVGESWRAMESLERYESVRPDGSIGGTSLVQSRRSRPRDPLLPHGPPRRGRFAHRGHRRDPSGMAGAGPVSCRCRTTG